MKEVTKRVAPGKINQNNVIKSCQFVPFSWKTATERLSSSTLLFCQALQDRKMDPKRHFSKLNASYLPLKDPWSSLVWGESFLIENQDNRKIESQSFYLIIWWSKKNIYTYIHIYVYMYNIYIYVYTGIPWIVRFFGPQQTALLEKPH